MKAKSTPGRPPVKQAQVLEALRSRIVKGDLAVRARLPTCRELGAQFGVSRSTAQQALDQLAREGFIEVRSTVGAFVADRLPHMSNYALVVPEAEHATVPRRRYVTALLNEAERFNQAHQGKRRLIVWQGIDGHQDNEDYHRLVNDVRRHRVAGLIFANPAIGLHDTPLMNEPGVPRVQVGPVDAASVQRGVVSLDLDKISLLTRGVEDLARRGRKRVALLVVPNPPANVIAAALERVRACGMICRPYWVQQVHFIAPQAAEGVVHLLLHAGQAERPDALLIADDNLVEHATAGLLRAGMRVPDDIEVVAHCNFPWPTPSIVPARRVGYDVRRILSTAISLIDRMRGGEAISAETAVKIMAEFEDEVRSGAQMPSIPSGY